VPEHARSIVDRALQKDPHHRFHNASLMAGALADALATLPRDHAQPTAT
jgi:hypothetical protein